MEVRGDKRKVKGKETTNMKREKIRVKTGSEWRIKEKRKKDGRKRKMFVI